MERVLRKYLSMFIEKDTGEEQVTCKTEENSGLSGQFKEGRKEFEAAGIDRRLGLSYFDNNEADYMEIVQCFMNREEVRSRHYRSCMIKKTGKIIRSMYIP